MKLNMIEYDMNINKLFKFLNSFNKIYGYKHGNKLR